MIATSSSTIKLTDTQLVALTAASQRIDRCIVLPEHLKGGAIAKFAASFISKSVAKEIAVDADMPVTRRDGDQAFALVTTTGGFAALGVEPADEPCNAGEGEMPPSDGVDTLTFSFSSITVALGTDPRRAPVALLSATRAKLAQFWRDLVAEAMDPAICDEASRERLIAEFEGSSSARVG
jgi:hypothetical protein